MERQKTIADMEPVSIVSERQGGWVSLDTGEILGESYESPPQENAEWLDDLPPAPTGPEMVEDYLRELVRFDAEEVALKTMHAKRMLQVKARRSYLDWQCKAGVAKQVAKDLEAQRGKKRSVSYAHGTAGWRKSKKAFVRDEAAARYWAAKNCPEAIKRPEPYLLKSRLPKDVEVPGVVRIEEDSFFARGAG